MGYQNFDKVLSKLNNLRTILIFAPENPSNPRCHRILKHIYI